MEAYFLTDMDASSNKRVQKDKIIFILNAHQNALEINLYICVKRKL